MYKPPLFYFATALFTPFIFQMRSSELTVQSSEKATREERYRIQMHAHACMFITGNARTNVHAQHSTKQSARYPFRGAAASKQRANTKLLHERCMLQPANTIDMAANSRIRQDGSKQSRQKEK